MAMNSPDELGWFGSSAARKVGKTASKAGKKVRSGVNVVYKPYSKIERAVRPIGKKIPIVGEFAQLHEDITEPLERRILGLKGKPNKTQAEKLTTMLTASVPQLSGALSARGLPSGPAAVKALQTKAAGQLKGLAQTGNPNAQKMLDLAIKARATIAQKSGKGNALTRRIASAARAGMPTAKAGMYLVIRPDGKRVEIPASKVR